ncbi:MAG TPA: alpha/beta fold hydrolase [Opitutales bacterium]|nr:alpha/beta fold hydrolase [Opitutales bacterium]
MGLASKPAALHFEVRGESGPVVVLVHGLLGSSRNWHFIAGELGKRYRVIVPDQRNHGDSPHTGPFDIADLAADLGVLIEREAPSGVCLVGHSLGGKASMRLACERPGLVRRLVIADISSEVAPRRWDVYFKVMQDLDLAFVTKRSDAENFFEAKGVADWGMRKFLSSNLVQEGKVWRWRIGLEALSKSAVNVTAASLEPGMHYDGPSLLVRGGASDYAPLADLPAMKTHFPALRVETIPEVGHNLHIEAPRAFLDAIRGFLAA